MQCNRSEIVTLTVEVLLDYLFTARSCVLFYEDLMLGYCCCKQAVIFMQVYDHLHGSFCNGTGSWNRRERKEPIK